MKNGYNLYSIKLKISEFCYYAWPGKTEEEAQRDLIEAITNNHTEPNDIESIEYETLKIKKLETPERKTKNDDKKIKRGSNSR